MHRPLFWIFCLFVVALWQNTASAALKFGDEDKIRFIANTTLEGPKGERLYLARRLTTKSFLLPYTIEDNGFVLGVSGDSTRYFDFPENERLAEIQKAGHLPSPLPIYELDLADVLFGRSLWIVLLVLGAYGAYQFIFRRHSASSHATASDGRPRQ